jgi:purine-nucleoside phosphorylase
MPELIDRIEETRCAIAARWNGRPQVGIILGTGLGALVKDIRVAATISYRDLPHFPVSTVESHAGNLICGTLAGKTVVAMQGRFHRYEGYSLQEVTFPVRVLKALGASTLCVSNAGGGLNPQFTAGDVMLITDHINLLGDNPLIGRHDDRLGLRFPDMSQPYSRALIQLAGAVALEEKIKLQRGVYAALSGPSLETAAEYRCLRLIGADAVGMSTVPEVIVAIQCGLAVLGLSIVTDMCLPDALKPARIEDIIAIAGTAEPKLTTILKKVIARL